MPRLFPPLLLLGVLLMILSGCASAPPPILSAPPANPAAPFTATLSGATSSPTAVGDRIALRIGSGIDGFAQLYLLRASGSVLVMAENLPVAAVRARAFPGPDDGFKLLAAPPAGRDIAVLLITRAPFAPGLVAPARQDPVLSPYDVPGFLARLHRAVADLPVRDWSVATLPIDVQGNR